MWHQNRGLNLKIQKKKIYTYIYRKGHGVRVSQEYVFKTHFFTGNLSTWWPFSCSYLTFFFWGGYCAMCRIKKFHVLRCVWGQNVSTPQKMLHKRISTFEFEFFSSKWGKKLNGEKKWNKGVAVLVDYPCWVFNFRNPQALYQFTPDKTGCSRGND